MAEDKKPGELSPVQSLTKKELYIVQTTKYLVIIPF